MQVLAVLIIASPSCRVSGAEAAVVSGGYYVARPGSSRPARTPFTFLIGIIRTVFMSAVMLVFSPFVILVDIFRRNRSVSRVWSAWFMVILGLVVGLSWSTVLYVSQQADKAASVFSSYTQVRSEVTAFPFSDLINLYSVKYDLDPSLVASIISQESHFKPTAVSETGARGLMQIMPTTWREFNPGSQCTGEHDPPATGSDCIFAVEANLRTGIAYLRALLDRFDGDVIMALAAYNAGAARVMRFEAEEAAGVPPFPETRNYVQRIVNYWSGIRHDAANFDVNKFNLARRMQRWLIVTSVIMWFVFFIWVIRKAGMADPKS